MAMVDLASFKGILVGGIPYQHFRISPRIQSKRACMGYITYSSSIIQLQLFYIRLTYAISLAIVRKLAPAYEGQI